MFPVGEIPDSPTSQLHHLILMRVYARFGPEFRESDRKVKQKTTGKKIDDGVATEKYDSSSWCQTPCAWICEVEPRAGTQGDV